MKPLITIIIPCYNVEQYLERCVESVLNQTIGQDKMEIILVDDCSTDRTRSIIKHYESTYECIKAIYNEKNQRQGGARNRGLEIAQGKYIGFVDSDDWIEPNMYKDMCICAEQYDCDLVNILSIRDSEYRFIPYESLEEENIKIINIENDDQRAEMIAAGQVKIGAWNCIFLSDMIIRNDIRFPENLFYEDIYWGALVHLCFKRASLINKPYYHYFVRADSTVLSNDIKRHEDFFIMQEKLWDEMCKRDAVRKYGHAIEFDYIMNYYLIGMKILSLRFTEFPYELYYRMQRDITERIPEWTKNQYIKTNTSDFQKMQLEILKYRVNRSELDQLAEITGKYYSA